MNLDKGDISEVHQSGAEVFIKAAVVTPNGTDIVFREWSKNGRSLNWCGSNRMPKEFSLLRKDMIKIVGHSLEGDRLLLSDEYNQRNEFVQWGLPKK